MINPIVAKNPEYKLEKDNEHVSPVQSPDTLFHFVKKIDYLYTILDSKLIFPWYCEEDVSYLKLDGISKIAIPMKCFCDIKLHNLKTHIHDYGNYGIAFSKEFGIRNGIQPIQYLNPKSDLAKNLAHTFNLVKNDDRDDESLNELKSFLLHSLMYCKPDQGIFVNRDTGKDVIKCFTDECEWRFVPDVSSLAYNQILLDENAINNEDIMNNYNVPLSQESSVSIPYSYSDVKHIILKTESDFTDFTEHLSHLNLSVHEREKLISKVIIWDLSEGDF